MSNKKISGMEYLEMQTSRPRKFGQFVIYGNSDWPMQRYFVLSEINMRGSLPANSPSWIGRKMMIHRRCQMSLDQNRLVSPEEAVESWMRERETLLEGQTELGESHLHTLAEFLLKRAIRRCGQAGSSVSA